MQQAEFPVSLSIFATQMAKKHFIIPAVLIHGIADRGKGVGRSPEGMTVFVEGAVPGDVVDVFVQKKKSGFAEGRVERLVSPSPDRVAPQCAHFSVCGGCKWQNLSYEAQLRHKQQVVEDALLRLGKLDVGAFLPILGTSESYFYRNKLEFAFSNKKWLTEPPAEGGPVGQMSGLGFHKAVFFDKVIDIEKCWLQADPSNLIRNTCREIALEQELEFYDLRKHKGFLRNLMLRITTTGETMALFSFARHEPRTIAAYLDAVADRLPFLTTVMYCINDKLNDTVFDLDMVAYRGKGFVVEKLGELLFKIGPKSFFQTNSMQGRRLYDVIVEFAGLKGDEVVYDLYTGTGSIALYIAKYCRWVLGIEEVPEAIVDAEENKHMNGIQNAIFYVGDVKTVLSPEFVQRHGRPDVLITDPPRVGMHEKVVQFLHELRAPRIVYVSCNPATQARDLQWLSDTYKVLKVRPVDMFPHTHHIENVALLALR